MSLLGKQGRIDYISPDGTACGEWETQAEIFAAETILKIQIFVFTCKP